MADFRLSQSTENRWTILFVILAVLFFIGSLKANIVLISRCFQNRANDGKAVSVWNPSTPTDFFTNSMQRSGMYYLLIQQYQASAKLVNRNDNEKLMPVYNVFIIDVLNKCPFGQKRFHPYSMQHT